MASFDKYSNYDKSAGVTGVVFGANAPVLEVELNEMQEIQKTFLGNTFKNLIGDGVSNKKAITYANNTLSISDCFFSISGYLIQCTGLSLAITSGTVYLQAWEETVDYNATLKTAGNEQSTTTVENYLKDSRSPVETSRRKVVKYTLSTTTDSTKQNLAIASVSNGVMTRIVKEVNLTNLGDKVLDLQTYIGYYGEGVLGVEVDLDNNTIKRVGGNESWSAGSDYLNSAIYSGRKRCNVTDDGVVVAYYGSTAYTESGALTVEVVGTNGVTYPVGTKVQCMVIQPKFYYRRVPIRLTKQTNSSRNVKGYHMTKWIDLISPVARDGFKVHPAFKKGDVEIDYYFIGENEGCVEDSSGAYDLTDSTSIPATPYTGYKFSSIANAKPASGATKDGVSTSGSKDLSLTAIRQLCLNRGADWQQLDITILSAEQMLYLIEFAVFNHSLTSLGVGFMNSKLVTDVNDSVPNPENTSLGNGSGILKTTYTHSNGTVYSNVEVPVFRGVKNPFCNICKFIDGLIRNFGSTTTYNEAYWHKGGSDFSNTLTDYIATGFSFSYTAGFTKAFGYSEDSDFFYLTSAIGGDNTKPVGSNFSLLVSSYADYVFYMGTSWNNANINSGLFSMGSNYVNSKAVTTIGGRLCRKSASVVFAV